MLDAVDAYLVDEAGPEALDLFGLHGLLTAWNLLPGCTRNAPWCGIPSELFLGEATLAASNRLELLKEWLPGQAFLIGQQLDDEAGLILPEELDQDEDALQSWAAGFMSGVFSKESEWFRSDREQEVAALLLPILVFSGLAEDEFEEVMASEQAMLSLLEQLPETLTELNLLLNGS